MLKKSSALFIFGLFLSSAGLVTTAFAFEEGSAINDQRVGLDAAKTDSDTAIGPLPSERLAALGLINEKHEDRARYGLLDRNEERAHYHGISDQQEGLIEEIQAYQVMSRLEHFKSFLEERANHSLVAKSAVMMTAAYLIYNGKPVKARLTTSTEVSARTTKNASNTRSGAFALTHRDLSPLQLTSRVNYLMDSQEVTASISRSIAPHVTASLNTKRSIASGGMTLLENTGQLEFGTRF